MSKAAPLMTMQPIKKLNDDDVLFGRGSAQSQYIGSRRFRELCEPQKGIYNSASKNNEKQAIAKEIVDKVHSLGGRFLQLDTSAGILTDIVEEGVWYEVDDKKAIDKAKQALRQIPRKRDDPAPEHQMSNILPSEARSQALSEDTTKTRSSAMPAAPVLSTPTVFPVLPPAAVVANAVMDPRLVLLQAATLNYQYANTLLVEQARHQSVQRALLANAMSLPAGSAIAASRPAQQQQPSQLQRASLQNAQVISPDTVQSSEKVAKGRLSDGEALDGSTRSSGTATDESAPERNTKRPSTASSMVDTAAASASLRANASGKEDDEDVSDFLMSVLQLSGLPRFTEHEQERANMTDEEKAAALSDMFGKYCNVDTHENKRARRDLDGESIAFLIRLMRAELERFPKEKKQALMEAQEKCREEEFSDERLEQFLRCEGMDVQRATVRFVNYWEARRELFGPEKFVMRMTLSEALRDDLVALEVGWLCLLPTVDTSGRQLLCREPSRHKREGYTSESMLRAAWYVIEVAAQLSRDMDCGVVELIWDKHSTIWEYDHQLYEKYAYYESSVWPVKWECIHVCCTPKFIKRVVFPICSAFQSKESRIRSVWHDAPEEDILLALSEYGIHQDMLPTAFGGTIQLNPSDWIAHRRAVEMDEL